MYESINITIFFYFNIKNWSFDILLSKYEDQILTVKNEDKVINNRDQRSKLSTIEIC